MALISCTIGGGIVGMPFCFLNCGILISLGLILFFCVLSYLATLFLLRAKDNCPKQYESYFEIGYATLGKNSIYFIASCMVAA
jgi:amino acid permease